MTKINSRFKHDKHAKARALARLIKQTYGRETGECSSKGICVDTRARTNQDVVAKTEKSSKE